MNISLLQQNFTQYYPDEYDGILEATNATVLTVAFNRRGTLLAGGCNDGKILIWDFITRGLIKIVLAHSHPVSSISWSRNGQFLVSVGADNYLHVWEVLTGKCVFSFRSTLPVLTATWCPRVYDRQLLNPTYRPANKNLARTRSRRSNSNSLSTKEENEKKPTSDTINATEPEKDINSNHITNKLEKSKINTLPHLLVQPLQSNPRVLDIKSIVQNKDTILTNKYMIEFKSCCEENDVNFVVSWNRRGDRIYVGNGRGKIFVYSWVENRPASDQESSYWTFDLKQVFKIPQPYAVRLLAFSRKTNKFLIVTDRLIRLYQEEMLPDNIGTSIKNAKELAPYQTIKDQISRQTWRVCCFSGDSEYICAGQVKQNSLLFYETAVRSENLLVKTLSTKGNDCFTDVVWHPSRPVLCCIATGEVSIYTHNYIENWSAYAPDFEELEENRIYMEKENEFDDSDEDNSFSEEEDGDDEINVDVCKLDRVAAYCSSDEEEIDGSFLEHIPLTVEQIEIGGELMGNFVGNSTNKANNKSKKDDKQSENKVSLGIGNQRSNSLATLANKVISENAETDEKDSCKNSEEKTKITTDDINAIDRKSPARFKIKEDDDLDGNKDLIVKSFELNFGSNSNLIHPLLVPTAKARNAMKRKQDKAAIIASESESGRVSKKVRY